MGEKRTGCGSTLRSVQRGASVLTYAVFLVLVGICAYVGYKVVPFYYYYYDLLNQFEEVIKVASLETDSAIRQKLMYHIKKYGIPCDPEDLRIERSDNMMTIRLQYQEVFYITFRGKDYTIRTFDFDATTTGKFK